MSDNPSTTPTTLSCGPHGNLRGLLISHPSGTPKCKRFLQIPYAEPPVGELRWRRPNGLTGQESWEGVDGTRWGDICLQPQYDFVWPQPPATAADGTEDPNPFNEAEGAVTSPASASSSDNVTSQSEDCLTINVWTPTTTPPTSGWPVLVYIHGGWLQTGNPMICPEGLIAPLEGKVGEEGAGMEVVVVSIGYRLGVFGFLSASEIQSENPTDGLAGNFGFHDQRLALEFISKEIHHFGGDPSNITLAGLSAGAYSTEAQVYYDMGLGKGKSAMEVESSSVPAPPTGVNPGLIKRFICYSNSISSQPKTVQESQSAFNGLLKVLDISLESSAEEKMRVIRKLSGKKLIAAVTELMDNQGIHTFRAVTDGVFIRPDMMQKIEDGTFAREFWKRGMGIILGEVDEEEKMYSVTNPPDSMETLRVQLDNYYNPSQVTRMLSLYREQLSSLPERGRLTKTQQEDLREIYGKMTADWQIYVPERRLVRSLWTEGVKMLNEKGKDAKKEISERVLRYRINWVTEKCRKQAGWAGSITHSEDSWLWWYNGDLMNSEEAIVSREWVKPLEHFIKGDLATASQLWWNGDSPKGPEEVRILADGRLEVSKDTRWEASMEMGERLLQEKKG